MHRFTLRQLEYLVACIECRSVAGAAERLNVSQPTISVAITKLEEQLGVQLLLRHASRGVTATGAAEKVLHSARSLLAHASDLERQAIETGSSVVGELRLGSFSTLAPTVLPNLIHELSTEHPGLKLHLREGPQDQIIAALEDGLLDLALLYNIDLPDDLHTVLLAQRKPYVALAADHPLARQESVALADLEAEPLILLEVAPSHDYFLGLFRDVGLEPVIAHSSPSIELVRGMVGCGLGYSLLVTRPDGDRTYDGRTLAIRPLSDEVPSSEVVLARLATLRPTQLMKSFEAVAARVMQRG
ncbi:MULTISPECIES: LysR family transcriptional regulator [unclassified Roseovarius]|uniref:LysR family transcriptional regulator n=1 Tax=unclassified Roseovarius TaxID=2614913 RepID=UPI00273D5511|nr:MULTISPECIES: LysR family transcriptional regulator [unclassified Roseovarius]